MNGIDAQPRTVRELLSKRKYGIDDYQREYQWSEKNIQELLNDLASRFLLDYDPAHERYRVEKYRNYFLGSVIMSRRDGMDFIVDGQQRITSLTLLLIYLHHLQNALAPEHPTSLEDMIFSVRYGRRSFNLDVPERSRCLEALYTQQAFDAEAADESVQTMIVRYDDITEQFPEELKGAALPYFIDWLLEKVRLIEISTTSDDDAYTIFETMNDRGQQLGPADMMKGYLLAKIASASDRIASNREWRDSMLALREFGRDEDADFLKHLLRARYARSVRERNRSSDQQDFERIGSAFHKWVRDNYSAIGLYTSQDVYEFIHSVVLRYAREYRRIRLAAEQLMPGFETIYYNAANNFTLQYPVLLAALRPDDDRKTVDKKIRMTAAFIDILIARRAVNFYELKYSAMVYSMFMLIRAIREKSVQELRDVLKGLLADMNFDFGGSTVDMGRRGMPEFYLNVWSKRYIHVLLARITAHIEVQSGMTNAFPVYINRGGGKPYEIEHVWSNHFGEHTDEFDRPEDFQWVRNKVGGLLLLPRGFNQSFGDLPYEEKRRYYLSQNILARSLHEQCYERNPGFMQYVLRSGQPFCAHAEFKRADVEQRQMLYYSLCNEIWNPGRIDAEAEF